MDGDRSNTWREIDWRGTKGSSGGCIRVKKYTKSFKVVYVKDQHNEPEKCGRNGLTHASKYRPRGSSSLC